jgi:hypothetical protein
MRNQDKGRAIIVYCRSQISGTVSKVFVEHPYSRSGQEEFERLKEHFEPLGTDVFKFEYATKEQVKRRAV